MDAARNIFHFLGVNFALNRTILNHLAKPLHHLADRTLKSGAALIGPRHSRRPFALSQTEPSKLSNRSWGSSRSPSPLSSTVKRLFFFQGLQKSVMVPQLQPPTASHHPVRKRGDILARFRSIKWTLTYQLSMANLRFFDTLQKKLAFIWAIAALL